MAGPAPTKRLHRRRGPHRDVWRRGPPRQPFTYCPATSSRSSNKVQQPLQCNTSSLWVHKNQKGGGFYPHQTVLPLTACSVKGGDGNSLHTNDSELCSLHLELMSDCDGDLQAFAVRLVLSCSGPIALHLWAGPILMRAGGHPVLPQTPQPL